MGCQLGKDMGAMRDFGVCVCVCVCLNRRYCMFVLITEGFQSPFLGPFSLLSLN